MAWRTLPLIQPYVKELCREPTLRLLSPRFQWKGAESDIHDSRSKSKASRNRVAGAAEDRRSPPLNGMPEPTAAHVTAAGRLQIAEFRCMVMLNDVGPGGGALMVIPGSHKRGVPWDPSGVPHTPPGAPPDTPPVASRCMVS